MKTPVSAISNTIEVLLRTGAWKATKFLNEKQIVRASRKRPIRTQGNVELILTIGKPNFAERKFLKACKKAGEPLPVKKVQLKFVPKKK